MKGIIDYNWLLIIYKRNAIN